MLHFLGNLKGMAIPPCNGEFGGRGGITPGICSVLCMEGLVVSESIINLAYNVSLLRSAFTT